MNNQETIEILFDQGEYRGWKLTYDDYRPKTGRWQGIRFGVTLSGSTKENLQRSIDQRIKEYPSSGGA